MIFYPRKEHQFGQNDHFNQLKGYSDIHLTPSGIAHQIINYFAPTGKVLEPCAGPGLSGGFISHPSITDWCEIHEGRDFYDYHEKVDWIITNPPYSILSQFLEHSFEIADHIVFAPIKIEGLGSSKKKWGMKKHYGFGIPKIILLPAIEPPFPQTGFQYFSIYYQREWNGPTEWVDWSNYQLPKKKVDGSPDS